MLLYLLALVQSKSRLQRGDGLSCLGVGGGNNLLRTTGFSGHFFPLGGCRFHCSMWIRSSFICNNSRCKAVEAATSSKTVINKRSPGEFKVLKTRLG
uniref:Uncharacterized protein n=1 Tax=Physcomitrium patens TaxID=3218 RepID=A0A2K1IZU2_PHYPA|nr:hypothetical protein PHYPA_022686 [Physcomitrium patens]